MIFPTASKAKIGKEFSWPIGAEAISSALADVPQAATLELDFQEPDLVSLRYGGPPLVFEAEYFACGPSISSPNGSLSNPWQLHVRGVRCEARHRVKQLLLEQGLPEIVRPWLVKNYSPEPREGDARLRLWFDAGSDCLIARTMGTIGPMRVSARG